MILTSPALLGGFLLDDHFQRLTMIGHPGIDYSGWQLFSALSGNSELTQRFIENGFLPWWTPDTFAFAFFRPLSLLTMWLDYRLWPDSAMLMHAHSLLWFGLLVAVAAVIYRRFMGATWVAGLAALIYAIDEAHAIPAIWLANRNALLATLFGLLAILAHDRWRRGGARLGALVSPVCLALGLLSGEVAFGALAYLIAHALFLDTGRVRRRLLALFAPALVVGAWIVYYHVNEFGVSGSALYSDPMGDPLAFAGAIAGRAPFLLMGQWSSLPAGLGLFPSAGFGGFLWWLAAIIVILVGVVVVPLLRRDRVARFWCFGMLVSLVPACTVAPSNRLLFFVGLGAMGLLARIVAGVIDHEMEAVTPTGRGRFYRSVAKVCLVMHLVSAPIILLAAPFLMKRMENRMSRAIQSLPADPAVKGQEFVVINTPDFLMHVMNIRVVTALEGGPLMRRVRALSSGPTALEMSRLDDRTLRVRAAEGLSCGPIGKLFYDPRNPTSVGDVVRLTGMTVEVTAITDDGRAQEAIYRFSVPLDDPSLRWLQWREGVYIPFNPPPAGESILVRRVKSPFPGYDRFPRWLTE